MAEEVASRSVCLPYPSSALCLGFSSKEEGLSIVTPGRTAFLGSSGAPSPKPACLGLQAAGPSVAGGSCGPEAPSLGNAWPQGPLDAGRGGGGGEVGLAGPRRPVVRRSFQLTLSPQVGASPPGVFLPQVPWVTPPRHRDKEAS